MQAGPGRGRSAGPATSDPTGVTSLDVAPTILHVAPHPDDEAVGCPGALLHLLDRGWTVVSLIASLGFAGQWERRRAEAEEAAQRAGFVPVFLDPPLNLDLDADLALATRRVATELPGIVEAHDASIVVSPSPHDVHHGHETVGRGVQRAMAALPPTAALVDVGRLGRPSGSERLLRLRRIGARSGPPHPRRLRGRARAQRLPALPLGPGGGERRDGLRACLRVRLPRRHRPPLRRAR